MALPYVKKIFDSKIHPPQRFHVDQTSPAEDASETEDNFDAGYSEDVPQDDLDAKYEQGAISVEATNFSKLEFVLEFSKVHWQSFRQSEKTSRISNNLVQDIKLFPLRSVYSGYC